MATVKQIDANRRNAAKSTGPRTGAGKDRASQNATRHGLYSNRVVLQFEHAGHYEQLAENLVRDWKPVGAQEFLLVEQIAQAAWRLQRAIRVETGAFDLYSRDLCHKAGVGDRNPHGDEGLAIVFAQNKFDLDRLRRYITSTQRSYLQLIEQLVLFQKNRSKMASLRTLGEPLRRSSNDAKLPGEPPRQTAVTTATGSVSVGPAQEIGRKRLPGYGSFGILRESPQTSSKPSDRKAK